MTIEELEAQLETVTRERDEARAYAEDRNDEANKLQRCLNMAATERDEAREQAKAYNDNAYALSLGVDQLTKERDEARSLLTQARVAVEHERDRLSDCEHDPDFCTCDEAARTSVLLAKIDAMIVDPSEMRRLRILERDEARAEVERLREEFATQADISSSTIARMKQQQREARAEVERLRVKAEAYGGMVDGCGPALEAAGHPIDPFQPDGRVGGIARSVAALIKERDEARAEVERLRAEAASFLAMARITDEKHDMKCAEVEMLRGVGCMEDGDGPCGVCRKCAYRRGAEAMRLACLGVVERFMDFGSPHPGMIAHKMSALPIPEET